MPWFQSPAALDIKSEPDLNLSSKSELNFEGKIVHNILNIKILAASEVRPDSNDHTAAGPCLHGLLNGRRSTIRM